VNREIFTDWARRQSRPCDRLPAFAAPRPDRWRVSATWLDALCQVHMNIPQRQLVSPVL